MRYTIKNDQVTESMFIDAPFDTRQDAQDALVQGMTVCQHCNCTTHKDEMHTEETRYCVYCVTEIESNERPCFDASEHLFE